MKSSGHFSSFGLSFATTTIMYLLLSASSSLLQAACDALEGSLIRELGEAEKGEGVAEDGEHAAQSVVDLDAAVAFSRRD